MKKNRKTAPKTETVTLSFPYLGYYGPQSGIRFAHAYGFNDYAETEEEMKEVFTRRNAESHLKIVSFDIEPDEGLDEYCGYSEIREFFSAVSAVYGTPFSGSLGIFHYTLSKSDDGEYAMEIQFPVGKFTVKVTAEGCALALVRAFRKSMI